MSLKFTTTSPNGGGGDEHFSSPNIPPAKKSELNHVYATTSTADEGTISKNKKTEITTKLTSDCRLLYVSTVNWSVLNRSRSIVRSCTVPSRRVKLRKYSLFMMIAKPRGLLLILYASCTPPDNKQKLEKTTWIRSIELQVCSMPVSKSGNLSTESERCSLPWEQWPGWINFGRRNRTRRPDKISTGQNFSTYLLYTRIMVKLVFIRHV